MKKGRGKTKFKNSSAFVDNGTPTGAKVETLSEALAQDAICGCGIDCECWGYIIVWDWNSTTGTYTRKARYLVDGVEKIDTIENAQAEISAYKAFAGGLVAG